MSNFITYSVRFILLILFQAIVLNQIEISFGLQIMVYPLFIFLLPHKLNPFALMALSFTMGFIIDVLSNTYGLHTSSAVLFAFLKPVIFKYFEPREGYDELIELNVHTMKLSWNIYVFGILLTIHHIWFFLIEIFKFNEIHWVFIKAASSVVLSLVVCYLIQIIFIKKSKGSFIN